MQLRCIHGIPALHAACWALTPAAWVLAYDHWHDHIRKVTYNFNRGGANKPKIAERKKKKLPCIRERNLKSIDACFNHFSCWQTNRHTDGKIAILLLCSMHTEYGLQPSPLYLTDTWGRRQHRTVSLPHRNVHSPDYKWSTMIGQTIHTAHSCKCTYRRSKQSSHRSWNDLPSLDTQSVS